MKIYGLTFLISFTPPESFSDLVSYAALIFSGITIFISIANYHAAKRSAESAAISAESGTRSATAAEQSAQFSNRAIELAKEQTEYMKNDTLNKYMPKLLPSTQKFYLLATDIGFIYDITKKVNNSSSIFITNVTQGNAYMVSSWLEISQENLLAYFYKEKSSDLYNNMNRYNYNLIFQSNEDPVKSNLVVDFYDGPFNFSSYSTSAYSKGNHIESIIRPEAKYKVFVPDYVKQVILHTLYSRYENKDNLLGPQNAIIKLVIQYKTGSQLDSDNFMTRKYSLSFSDVKYSTSNVSPEISIGDAQFEASLNFKFLEDTLN